MADAYESDYDLAKRCRSLLTAWPSNFDQIRSRLQPLMIELFKTFDGRDNSSEQQLGRAKDSTFLKFKALQQEISSFGRASNIQELRAEAEAVVNDWINEIERLRG